MKKRIWFGAVAILLLTSCKKNPSANIIDPTGCNYVMDETQYTNNGWTKVFEDNFDTDLSKWNIWTGGAYNNELQFYQAANLQLVSGSLAIIAKKEKVTGATLPTNPALSTFNYTSGRLECKANISANTVTPKLRIMARIQLPKGYGMWPAFWSMGDPWPTQGEIDFVEARGNEPTKYSTNYYYGSVAGTIFNEDAAYTVNAISDLTNCYHVYEIEWAQNTLTSYLDGKLVETKRAGTHIPDLFGKTEHIVLNLAIGGSFFPGLDKSLIETGTMYVDWVKVFTSK
ncbi:MAG: glycoside hydrolase family 16 protein [Bacteroidota bacterium]